MARRRSFSSDCARSFSLNKASAIAGFNSLTVGQEQIDQYRRYAARSGFILPGQSLERRRATSDPFELKRIFGRVGQRFLDTLGAHRIILDQEYIVRHSVLRRINYHE